MEKLLKFLNDVKAGEPVVTAPTYSHQVYDVQPDKPLVIDRPDILIVEGINTLQLQATSACMSATISTGRSTSMPTQI